MTTLLTQKRDPKDKPKFLRRNGFIPGCIYGKNFDPSLLFQVPERELNAFLRENSVGSTVTVKVDDQEVSTILKEVTVIPLTPHYEHICFQELIKGKKLIGNAKLTLKNADKAKGEVEHLLYEVEYKTIPQYLVQEVVIDLEGKKIGDAITLADLPELNNEHIDLLMPLDSVVVEMKEIIVHEEETDEDEPVVVTAEVETKE